MSLRLVLLGLVSSLAAHSSALRFFDDAVRCPAQQLSPVPRDYNKLTVWQKAHRLAIEINQTSVQLPRDRAALASQMRRAAESIATNIVEGCGRFSQRDFARFLQISIGSTTELEYQLRLAHDYNILDPRVWERLSGQAIEVRRMLIGLIRKVRNDLASHGTGR